MERSSAPIIGLAVLVALASAVYAFMMRGELMAQKETVAATEKKLAAFTRTADDANRKSAVAKASLDMCNTQLADAQAKLDAMAKPLPRPKRSPVPPTEP
jgi:Tfp pilus assembly protein PilO